MSVHALERMIAGVQISDGWVRISTDAALRQLVILGSWIVPNDDAGEPRGEKRSLRAAIRKARLSQTERMDVIVDLREAEQARLDILFDELQPVFDEMPDNYDQFECALVPGDPPRLWIDMLTYVVMASDKRTYRLVKDVRDGRRVLQETTDKSAMADHVTDYLAHRVIERERALESEVHNDIDEPEEPPVEIYRGYSGMAVFLSLMCGVFLGMLGLFLIGALVTIP